MITYKTGIIFGFANEGRKLMLRDFEKEQENQNIYIKPDLALLIIKPRGFENDKDHIQQNVLKVTQEFDLCHIIFIVLAYDRLDNMKKKLNLLLKYFKPYSKNTCLVISRFEKSKNQLRDLETFQRKLVTDYDFMNLFAYSNKGDQDYFIDQDRQYNREEYFQFVIKQLQWDKSIQFNPIEMGLQFQQDQAVVEMLETFINKAKLEQQYSQQNFNISTASEDNKIEAFDDDIQKNEIQKSEIQSDIQDKMQVNIILGIDSENQLPSQLETNDLQNYLDRNQSTEKSKENNLDLLINPKNIQQAQLPSTQIQKPEIQKKKYNNLIKNPTYLNSQKYYRSPIIFNSAFDKRFSSYLIMIQDKKSKQLDNLVKNQSYSLNLKQQRMSKNPMTLQQKANNQFINQSTSGFKDFLGNQFQNLCQNLI